MYGIKSTIKPASTHVDVINIDTFIKRQDGYIEFQWFDHFLNFKYACALQLKPTITHFQLYYT